MTEPRQPDRLTPAQVKAIEVYLLSLCYQSPVEVLQIVLGEIRSLGLISQAVRYTDAIKRLNEPEIKEP